MDETETIVCAGHVLVALVRDELELRTTIHISTMFLVLQDYSSKDCIRDFSLSSFVEIVDFSSAFRLEHEKTKNDIPCLNPRCSPQTKN